MGAIRACAISSSRTSKIGNSSSNQQHLLPDWRLTPVRELLPLRDASQAYRGIRMLPGLRRDRGQQCPAELETLERLGWPNDGRRPEEIALSLRGLETEFGDVIRPVLGGANIPAICCCRVDY